MKGWLSWFKMIFEFFKRLLGIVDEGSRKRRADELDDLPAAISSPKKHCCSSNGSQISRSVYADENVADEVEYIGRSSHHSHLNERPNGSSCVKRKRSSLQQTSPSICQKKFPPKVNGRELKPKNKPTNIHFTQMPIWNCRHLTLKKTNQLREKQEYGQLLQNFLPSRIQVIRDKDDANTKKEIVTEIIDLEKYETPKKISERDSSSRQSRDVYFTPKTFTSTPKWHTPRTSLSRESLQPREKEITILSERKSSKESTEITEKSSRSRKIVEKTETVRPTPFIIIESVADDLPSPTFKTISPEKSEPSTSKTLNHEILQTNTLRDNLAAKAVMKQDFIPRITGHYNERYEQRMKEAEEIKRMACLLSKHNRLAREAALETQLARSMRLCEAVLDETSAYEEEQLPELTPDMLKDIKNALVPHPANEVLVESFGLRITRKDIHTLVGLNWLNDEVINFYMNLLISRGNSGDRYPKVHAMNTFFYPKLLSGGHNSLKRWTRKIDVFAQDLLVVPIHLGIHWCMSVIDFRDKSIRYFDSMGGANPKCLSALRQYLQDESLDKKKKIYDMNDWTLESVATIPQQMNGSDCGVFSCMFAEFISADRKITFTQEDMPYFRKKMVYEILKAKLL